MAVDTGRPSQKTQKSRKGKKAWRKNIDLDEFEQNLDEQRDAEIMLGPNESLFTVDKVGSDEGLTPTMKRERQLKSYEILHSRSAVPALIPQHKKKDKPKTKVAKDRKELLERAGFSDKSATIAHVERDGILRSSRSGADLWDAPISRTPSRSSSSNRSNQIATARSAESLKPDAPIPGTQAVDLPLAGQSYNPALEDWKQAVLSEHRKLERDEAKRVSAEEQQARIDAIIAETEAKLENPSSDEESSEEEEIDPSEIGRLSVNKPALTKRKTRTERNRILRHKLRLFELNTLKQKKAFMAKLAAEAAERKARKRSKSQAEEDSTDTSSQTKEKEPKRLLRAHSAHQVMDEPLAIKLSDELDDSLRRLKPEGNLMKERLRSLQARGIIEARVPQKKKKSRSKMVEKWSYKDFK